MQVSCGRENHTKTFCLPIHIQVFLFVLLGAGTALCLTAGSAGVGCRRRSGVNQSAGSDQGERKQEIQGHEHGHPGVTAAQRQQEGLDIYIQPKLTAFIHLFINSFKKRPIHRPNSL